MLRRMPHSIRRKADSRLGRRAQRPQRVCLHVQEIHFVSWLPQLSRDDQMIWLVLLALVLMLTRLFTIGNAQSNGKKLPTNLIRNASSKDVVGTKSTAGPARSPTAIDPLSHVRLQYMLVPYHRLSLSHRMPHCPTSGALYGLADACTSTFSKGPTLRILYLRNYEIVAPRKFQMLRLEAQPLLI